MITFTKSVTDLTQAMAPYRESLWGFNPDTFFTEGNLAVTDGEGSYGLFEFDTQGVYTGHIFFKQHGKSAVGLGREMLKFFFQQTEAKVIRGLTPCNNRAARWMVRQLGFQSHGMVATVKEDCELFILTPDMVRN